MVRHSEVDSGAGHVLESAMITCQNCGHAAWNVTTLMDDPNDITEDAVFAAYDITITGGSIQGLVAKCHYCGREQVLYWSLTDVSASTGTSQVMTNLDAGTADTLADLYMYPCVGTDVGKYFVIASHTAATPTTITLTIAANNDCDGIWVITNLLPLGLTAAS